MIEIRPIRDHEANPFLELICEIFELDVDRAQGIFFNEPLFDLSRKWALFEGGQMASVLTTVPLKFGWGTAIGIAGVATKLARRRLGLAETLLNHVLKDSEHREERVALLFAKEIGLYEKCGFHVLDQVIRAPLVVEVDDRLSNMLSFDEIRTIYDRWSEGDENRLRRDDRRWKFWKWNLRVCTPIGDGYVCHEGQQIRELVIENRDSNLALPANSEWIGLRSMAMRLGLVMENPQLEMYLLGRGISHAPQMFLTDQF